MMLYMRSSVRTPSDKLALIADAIIESGGNPPNIDALRVGPSMSSAIDAVLSGLGERELDQLRRARREPSGAQVRVIMRRVLEFRLSRTERVIARRSGPSS